MIHQLFLINFVLVCLALFINEVMGDGGDAHSKRKFFIYGWFAAGAILLASYILYLAWG